LVQGFLILERMLHGGGTYAKVRVQFEHLLSIKEASIVKSSYPPAFPVMHQTVCFQFCFSSLLIHDRFWLFEGGMPTAIE